MNNAILADLRDRAARLVLATMLAAGCAAQAAEQSFLVKDGQPRAAIVIAEKPTRMQKLAAEQLQAYVRKITGAELPIASAPSNTWPLTVYVGTSEHTKKLGLKTDDLDYGAYRIRSGAGYLALVGRDDNYFMDKPGDGGAVFPQGRKEIDAAAAAWRQKHGDLWTSPFLSSYKGYNPALGVWDTDEHGSLNAVNDFLRSLGVRWYMPGDFGEVCPAMQSIVAPEIDETVRPEWKQREIHFHSANPLQIGAEEMLWQLRLGLRPLQEMVGGHGTPYLLEPEWVKRNKPDFYALYGGVRATEGQGKPCYSSQGLFDSAVGFATLLFGEYGKRGVSLLPTDGYTAFCQCDLCKGKDTPARGFPGMMSDYVWGFMNGVAAEVARTHPDREIMCYAYNTYLLPPEKIDRFQPNLRVGICGGRKAFHDPDAKQQALDIREGFLKKIPSGRISLWEYYNVTPGIPCYFPRIIAGDLRYLKGRIDGSMIEFTRGKRITSTDPAPDPKLATSHLNLWLTTLLWWNPDTEALWWNKGRSVADLLDEYYTNFYGPAAAEMKTFVTYCEDNWPAMSVKPEPIDKAFDLIARARQAAGTNNLHARRVQLVMDYMAPLTVIRDQLKVGREKNPVVRFTGFDAPPALTFDGRLDEPFWTALKAFELKNVATGGAMTNKTTFKVAWAGDSLYFGVRCEEEAMDKLSIPAKAHGDNTIFDGDSVEILLETPTHAYYQIAIDPAGHMNDLDRPKAGMIGRTGHYETKWESGAQVAALRGKDYWSFEARIPALGAGQEELLPLFGVSGDKPAENAPWYFNIGRIRHAGAAPQLSAFAPTGEPGFHYRRAFARLIPE